MKNIIKIVVTVCLALLFAFIVYYLVTNSGKPEPGTVEVVIEQPVEPVAEQNTIAVEIDKDGNVAVEGTDPETAEEFAKSIASGVMDGTLKSTVITVKPTEDVEVTVEVPVPEVKQ